MALRKKGAGGDDSEAIEVFSTGHGMIVEGSPTAVSLFIDEMVDATRGAGGQAKHLVVDAAQLAGNVTALRQTHRECERATLESTSHRLGARVEPAILDGDGILRRPRPIR